MFGIGGVGNAALTINNRWWGIIASWLVGKGLVCLEELVGFSGAAFLCHNLVYQESVINHLQGVVRTR